jgi:hypothetical protein
MKSNHPDEGKADKMAKDLKYGEVTVENEPGNPLNGTDEPVIVFRARDELAVPMLHRYKNLARATMEEGAERSVTPEFIEGVDQVIEAFENYRAENPDQMKLPD